MLGDRFASGFFECARLRSARAIAQDYKPEIVGSRTGAECEKPYGVGKNDRSNSLEQVSAAILSQITDSPMRRRVEFRSGLRL